VFKLEVKGRDGSSGPLIAFAGGGTGGHLFPALALADALHARVPRVRFQYFATNRPVDARILGNVPGEFISQSIPRLSKRPWKWPAVLRTLSRAFVEVQRRFDSQPPQMVIGTGGLASFPAMREAIRRGLPTAILNPDALPGRANRWLARQVDVVYAQWEETADSLSEVRELKVLGCPVRREFQAADRRPEPSAFGLDPARLTLLVTGASLGARTINDAVSANLEKLSELSGWQILHLTGEIDYQRVQQEYRRHSIAATVLPFTERMADAILAADLIVSRAGASTLAELTALGRASILMPYPHHRDRHQEANAMCLVRRSAATMLEDHGEVSRNAPQLWESMRPLLIDDVVRSRMADAAGRMGSADAAERIADDLIARTIFEKSLAERDSLQVTCSGTR